MGNPIDGVSLSDMNEILALAVTQSGSGSMDD
jgi:hypothetical protein